MEEEGVDGRWVEGGEEEEEGEEGKEAVVVGDGGVGERANQGMQEGTHSRSEAAIVMLWFLPLPTLAKTSPPLLPSLDPKAKAKRAPSLT